MRYLLRIIFFLLAISCFSQEELANGYFNKGEFDKALVLYQKLEKENKRNSNYKIKIIEIYRQLEQLDDAEIYLQSLITANKNPVYLVELGYNYQLKNNLLKAKEYYDLANDKLFENASYAYNIARTYESHSLLENATFVYNKAMEINSALNFNIQLARIYGEQGNIEKMFYSYMSFLQEKNSYIDHAKRAISGFISEDSQNENNLLLKKILLKKIQKEPDLLWNDLLSWLFIQQKDYRKSFTQEKAIFKRNPESLKRIIDLALTVIDEGDNDTAKEILNYLISTSQDIDTVVKANNHLLQLETKEIKNNNFKEINSKYNALFNEYGTNHLTLSLQLSYAHLLAFKQDKPQDAILFLKKTLKQPLSDFQKAEAKLKLGDILVFQEKFNEALIYYTQIQRSLKNSAISQEARFRVAKASYYKGDFEWAESQLKILKSSTSQLIANDALDLKLLISDNKYDDSSQTALKLYAKADLLAFQHKTKQAILLLDTILTNHKGETIADQALYMQAKLFEQNNQYLKAETNYNAIIADFREDILADDALYMLAELYSNNLDHPEKAKDLYEQIIFNHEDSIYFIEARKKYRALRGDAIN